MEMINIIKKLANGIITILNISALVLFIGYNEEDFHMNSNLQ